MVFKTRYKTKTPVGAKYATAEAVPTSVRLPAKQAPTTIDAFKISGGTPTSPTPSSGRSPGGLTTSDIFSKISGRAPVPPYQAKK